MSACNQCGDSGWSAVHSDNANLSGEHECDICPIPIPCEYCGGGQAQRDEEEQA